MTDVLCLATHHILHFGLMIFLFEKETINRSAPRQHKKSISSKFMNEQAFSLCVHTC